MGHGILTLTEGLSMREYSCCAVKLGSTKALLYVLLAALSTERCHSLIRVEMPSRLDYNKVCAKEHQPHLSQTDAWTHRIGFSGKRSLAADVM